MAFRAGRIQQEIFGAFLVSPPRNQTLVEVERLVDWKVLRLIMAPLYKDASQGGRAVYIGLDKVHLQMTLGVLAYNLRRYVALSLG